MRKLLRQTWDAAQPYLGKPRLWTAMIWRRFLGKTTFIAITGSNGKTTATSILTEILASCAPTQWTRKNRNSLGGFTETIAFCLPWKTRYAVFEVGAGKPNATKNAVRLIRPDISVVLSVFLEHRSFFRTIDAVAREKVALLNGLRSGGVAVLNADDPHVREMSVPSGCKVIRYGSSTENDAYYENIHSSLPGTLGFTAVVRGRRQEIHTRMLGEHWAGTVLACIAVADYLGVPLDQIARVIETARPYPGRMQVVSLPSGATVIRDEFKGSEHTVAAAFAELRKAEAQRKFLAFCDFSETSKSPRVRLERVGREAAGLVDYALFIGPKAHHAVHGAREGGLRDDKALALPDYAAAAQFLKPVLGPGDVLLLKAGRDNQLPRLFYSLLGEVKCTVSTCNRPMVCDDCPKFRNPELVQLANVQLSAKPD